MSFINKNMQKEADQILVFLKNTFSKNKINSAIIAVSGGIDSTISLTLISKAISPENVFPVLMPYGDQDMTDAMTICEWNQIPTENIIVKNIKSDVDNLCISLNISQNEIMRKGNIMARVRMIIVYDIAKNKQGLVVGTENKSEHYLGYFTRFGDGASDIEPIVHLYKTQVRQLAQYFEIPNEILTKKPSAGLWKDQTDENELGFDYEAADLVLKEIVDNKKDTSEINIENIPQEIIEKVVKRIKNQAFKLEVPYRL